MCDPRVSSRQPWQRDFTHSLQPQIELMEPGSSRPALRCRGELDTVNADALGAALDAACEREITELLLDFSAVEFIDGRILAQIERTRARLEASGASLRIHAAGQPLRLLRLTGIGDVDADAEAAPRFEQWLAPSSSFSSPTLTSAPPGEMMTR